MRRVLVAGLLGGLVMILWFIVANGILGFKSRIEMKQLPQERSVYAFLLEHVTEPGRYVLNPEIVPEQGFPGEAPIFSVHYTGLGHADAGQEMLFGLVVMFLSSVVGAWLLSNASGRVLSRYGSRVGFLATIGVVVALLGTGARFGLAAYSMGDALLLASNDFAAWLLMGLLVARMVRPTTESAATRAG